ncbi:unnamed protein product [Onchocerca flexuosa]|uniref:ZP domain-containing protein n=1 Tax=Onchocerca flexuosa TaxID=387005 RepID=A0A183H7X4_9BILA|nr:unnamed protein product [Onchocerca flexuosa]
MSSSRKQTSNMRSAKIIVPVLILSCISAVNQKAKRLKLKLKEKPFRAELTLSRDVNLQVQEKEFANVDRNSFVIIDLFSSKNKCGTSILAHVDAYNDTTVLKMFAKKQTLKIAYVLRVYNLKLIRHQDLSITQLLFASAISERALNNASSVFKNSVVFFKFKLTSCSTPDAL